MHKYKSLFNQNRQSAAFLKKMVVGMPISICTNKSLFNLSFPGTNMLQFLQHSYSFRILENVPLNSVIGTLLINRPNDRRVKYRLIIFRKYFFSHFKIEKSNCKVSWGYFGYVLSAKNDCWGEFNNPNRTFYGEVYPKCCAGM